MKKTIIALTIFIHLTALAPLAPAFQEISEPVPDPVIELTVFDTKQVNCLADNIYHEAKGEPEDGQKAVALVTMNRVHHVGFPDTVCGVVYEKTKGFCQFSWVCRKLKANKETENYQKIYKLAEETYLNYRGMVDITKRSLFFHATSVNPGWKLKRTIQFGRHIFYTQKENDVQQYKQSSRDRRT